MGNIPIINSIQIDVLSLKSYMPCYHSFTLILFTSGDCNKANIICHFFFNIKIGIKQNGM